MVDCAFEGPDVRVAMAKIIQELDLSFYCSALIDNLEENVIVFIPCGTCERFSVCPLPCCFVFGERVKGQIAVRTSAVSAPKIAVPSRL